MNNVEIQILAKNELIAISKNATRDEWRTLVLDVNSLDGGEPGHCVYGKMTGDCFSERALELIKKCADSMFFVTLTSKHAEDNLSDSGPGMRNFTALEVLLYYNKDEVIKMILEIDTQR